MQDAPMTEVASVTTFVVGDRLPWPDETSTSVERGPLDSAAIFVCGSREPCTIKKISALGVTVVSDLAPALGEKVAVELATGQRASGKISWTNGKELGIKFDDHVDMAALLNRKLVSLTPDRRSMPRVEVRSPAYVKWSESLSLGALRNISARGLQLEGDELPPIGTYVAVFVDGLNIPPGEVVWRRDKLAGIELFEELSWTSIIPWVRQMIRKGGD
jgi:PilZ domain-containing protein